jgi:acetyl esterase
MHLAPSIRSLQFIINLRKPVYQMSLDEIQQRNQASIAPPLSWLSAGGNLATVVCLMARDQQGPTLSRQVLIYPALDGTRSCPSHQRYGDAPLLPTASMDFFLDCYARSDADLQHPYFSPLLAQDVSRLPPALIQSAEHDPLHDEAVFYAEKLKAAGVEVQYSDYPGMIHAFLSFPRFCQGSRPAFAEIARFIQGSTSPA